MRGNLLGGARAAVADVLLVDNHAADRAGRRPSSDDRTCPRLPHRRAPTRRRGPPPVRRGAAGPAAQRPGCDGCRHRAHRRQRPLNLRPEPVQAGPPPRCPPAVPPVQHPPAHDQFTRASSPPQSSRRPTGPGSARSSTPARSPAGAPCPHRPQTLIWRLAAHRFRTPVALPGPITVARSGTGRIVTFNGEWPRCRSAMWRGWRLRCPGDGVPEGVGLSPVAPARCRGDPKAADDQRRSSCLARVGVVTGCVVHEVATGSRSLSGVSLSGPRRRRRSTMMSRAARACLPC